jgi:hypothetical protein|tara:strand:+ start:2033 stop:2584 length:552 start_codon:yes stop_codon:yes gene_type:complete
MTSRPFFVGFICLLAWSFSSLAVSSCKELAVTSIGDMDEFYVVCTNSLLKPVYVVTQYYGGTEHFGVLSLNVGNSGYFCSGDSERSSCQALPRGAIPYGTFKSRKSAVTVANLSEGKAAYKEKNTIFRFPKSHGAAISMGCFVVIQRSKDVIIGLSEDKLYQSAECLIALERYIISDKIMLFR